MISGLSDQRWLLDAGRVLASASPTVLTPASPESHAASPAIANLMRCEAVRSAPWGSPSAASHPASGFHRDRGLLKDTR